jgi:hypothetical protein
MTKISHAKNSTVSIEQKDRTDSLTGQAPGAKYRLASTIRHSPYSRSVERNLPFHQGEGATKFDRNHSRLQSNRRVIRFARLQSVALRSPSRTSPVVVCRI